MPHRGQVFDNGTLRLEVLTTAAESDGALHEMRATYAAGSPLPPAHLHPHQDETFTVLEGELEFLIDGEETVVGAGEEIGVPRGSVHQVRNAGAVPAVALWQTRPALRTGAFFEAITPVLDAEDYGRLPPLLEEYSDVYRLAPG